MGWRRSSGTSVCLGSSRVCKALSTAGIRLSPEFPKAVNRRSGSCNAPRRDQGPQKARSFPGSLVARHERAARPPTPSSSSITSAQGQDAELIVTRTFTSRLRRTRRHGAVRRPPGSRTRTSGSARPERDSFAACRYAPVFAGRDDDAERHHLTLGRTVVRWLHVVALTGK